MRKSLIAGLVVILLLFSTSVVLAIGGPTDQPTINIMTYNIRYGCGNDEVCTDFNTNVANIANIIESKNPDVVVLQETNKGDKKTFPILQQRLSGFIGKEFGTQAIFIRSNNQFVQDPAKHDLFSGRSYIRSVVAVRSIPYVIYQTHLTRPPQVNTVTACQPQSESRDFGKTLDEAAELNNALFGESLDSPVIITGDFNLPPDKFYFLWN
jgi:endonuclease/exonuclease/phosphatase family metal-dependent hydrolase